MFEGGIVQISAEPSPELNRARTSVNPNKKTVVIKLPEAFQANATNTFNPNLFATVAQGVVLAEAGLREPEMFQTPQGKQAIIELASGIAVRRSQDAAQNLMIIKDIPPSQLR